VKLDELCVPRSAGSVELAIDVSNVCRNAQLDSTGDPARWDRLLQVLTMWNEWPDAFEKPVVVLIADKNLRFMLSPQDTKDLDIAIGDGFAIESPNADPVLLELAEQTDCMVLSNDNFVSYRRGRQWMEAGEERFVQIRADGDTPRLEIVALAKRSSYSMSRAEEKDQLKELHIDVERDIGTEILRSLFRCDNPTCVRRSFMPEGAATTPERGSAGQAVCPGCQMPLTKVGEAQRTAAIKLFGVNSSDTRRVPVVVGSTVTIGRASDDLSLAELLNPDDLRRISREHLSLKFSGKGLEVVDLGTTNHSTIERWDRHQNRRGQSVRLEPGSPVELRPRDRVVMGGVLCLERSGRRFPFDLAPLASRRSRPNEAPQTVAQTGEDF